MMTVQTRAASADDVQVELQGNGASRMSGDCLKDFRDDLAALLARAGCVGTYRVHAIPRIIKGSAHKQGLTVGKPFPTGVEIYAQYADSGSREVWLITRQLHESTDKLQARLRAACDAIAEEAKRPKIKVVASNPDPLPSGDGIAQAQTAEAADQSGAEGTIESSQAGRQPEAESAAPQGPQMIRVYGDADNRHLFLSEVADLAKSGERIVERAVISNLLITQFGFSCARDAGSTFALFKRAGFLAAAGSAAYALTDMAYELIGRQPPPAIEPEAPDEPLPEPVAEAQPLAEPTTVSSYHQKMADLEREAASYDELEEQAADLEGVVASLRTVEEKLQEGLDRARADIAARLEEIEGLRARQAASADAKRKLDQVKSLLES